jgi:hypothetical protein
LSGFCFWKFKKKKDLEGKISLILNLFTLLNLEIFNSKNGKNKECSHLAPTATLVTMNHGMFMDFFIGWVLGFRVLRRVFFENSVFKFWG